MRTQFNDQIHQGQPGHQGDLAQFSPIKFPKKEAKE